MNHEAQEPAKPEWQNHNKERNMAQVELANRDPELKDFIKWHDEYGERFKDIFQNGEDGWKRVLDLMKQYPEASFTQIEQLYNETMH